MTLANKVQQFNDDADIAHEIIHGDASTTVETENGSVRSFAKVLADFAASIGSSLIGFIQDGTGAVARSVQSKLRDSVSVLDFMTEAQRGDVVSGVGSINVTAAIEAAWNATQAKPFGGSIEFPAGAYRITPGVLNLTASKWFRLHGAGRATQFFGDGTASGTLFAITASGNANGAVIENIGFVAPVSGTTNAFDLTNANVFHFNKVFFKGQDTDVSMSESFATRFTRCVHSNTRGSAVHTETLAHNTVIDACNYYGVGVTNVKPALNFSDASGNIVIINSDFEGCYRDGSFENVTSLTFDNNYSEYSAASELAFVGTCSAVSIEGCRLSDGAPLIIDNVIGLTFKRNTLKNQVVSLGASVTNVQEGDNVIQGTSAINMASIKVNSSATGVAPSIEAVDHVAATARLDYKTKGAAAHYFYANGVLQASVEYTANCANRAAIYGGEEGGYVAFRPVGGTNCSARISARGNGEVGIFTNSLTNLVMTFSHVASADNWIQATPGAAGSPVQLVAKGNTDSNVNIVVKPKGATGQAQLQAGDSSTKVGVNNTGIGFYGATPAAKPSITGSRGGNAALADLLTKLANLGLITDGTSA
jgi:hypothetical protein